MTSAEVNGAIGQLFTAAGVSRVISVDDMYADEAPASEAIAAFRALEPTEPGVCAAVFGETAGIDFSSDPDIVASMIETYWETIPLEAQRDILQELRSKLSQEDDVDRGAKTALSEFFQSFNFLPLSQNRWNQEKGTLISEGKALTLLLVDEDFSKESGGGRNDGLKIIKEVFAKADPNLFLCGLLSHGYEISDIHKQWNALCAREGLDKSRFVLIPKKLLDEGSEGFVNFLLLVKLAILNGPSDLLKRKAATILSSAQTSANNQLNSIDIYDFDHIVFRSSQKEGVWEPDTLFRVFGIYHRDQTRRSARLDRELHDLAQRIRIVSQVPTHSDTAPTHEAWKVQRLEMYEDDEALNPYLLPLELGDIFEKAGESPKKYILLAQPCDLMVRSEGERHFAMNEGLLAEIVSGDVDPRSHTELQYFDSSGNTKYFVSFKKGFAIKLHVLDFCSFNAKGESEFTVRRPCPPEVIPAWQNRYRALEKQISRALNRFKDLKSKGVDIATATSLVTRCTNDDKIKGEIGADDTSIRYPLRRICRLRQPRATALLAKYANFMAREAFDHDFGTTQ